MFFVAILSAILRFFIIKSFKYLLKILFDSLLMVRN